MKNIHSNCLTLFFKTFLVCTAFFSATFLTAAEDFVPKISESLQRQLDRCQDREMAIVNYHIHYRNGMTPEKAAIRELRTGIRSAILENHGRGWPLSDDAKILAFIEEVEKVRAEPRFSSVKLPVGIQVNDRDWMKQIDPKVREKLDFVLADTMIMKRDSDKQPQKLWLVDTIDDPEKWMEDYMNHNRQILGEPIDILANPTYLPKPIEHLYDKLWTEDRMKEIIQLAVDRGIAIEIQATSNFPNVTFLKLAKERGAKFSFGTNNHDAKPLPVDRWFKMIDELKLEKKDLWTLRKK